MSRHFLLRWSSSKDSAWALHLLRRQPDAEVAGLVATVSDDRATMLATPRTCCTTGPRRMAFRYIYISSTCRTIKSPFYIVTTPTQLYSSRRIVY